MFIFNPKLKKILLFASVMQNSTGHFVMFSVITNI